MPFNYDESVQQGWNRDITTNDWNVKATNLEVELGDRSGGTEFKILDQDHVSVAEITSDGYLSVLGNAEVHGGNILIKGTSANSEFITMRDEVDETSVFVFDEDPNGTIFGSRGSFGTNYNDGYMYVNIDGIKKWQRLAYKKDIEDISFDTFEPSGFVDKTDSKMEFDDETRTFTITPKDAAYDIYLVGKKVTIGDVRTVIIPDTEGMHYIYYDYVTEQLTTSMSFTSDIIRKHAFAAAIYWDNTTNNAHAIYFGDERHGITMDGATHEYLHTAFGAQWLSGLSLGSFTFGSGASDSHAEFAVTDGAITDEDLPTNLIDGAPQELDPLARIPVYYKTGATPYWRKKDQDEFPFIYSGTAGYTGGAGRIPYNQFTGGAWQLTEAPANDYYVLMHYFATNNVVNEGTVDGYGEPFVGIIGEEYYTSLADASDGARSEINNLYSTGMPVKEFVPIATVIFQTNGSYANTPNARVVQLSDGSDYVDWRIEKPVPGLGVSVVDHGNLTGLLDDDHPQYLRTDGTRPLSAPWDAQQTITTPQVRSDGILRLDGETGIVLDAYGDDVIPRTSCTDSLGDSTHGWTDIYLCSGSTVIGLNDLGDAGAPNNESGAYVIGTNSTNFPSFGPEMTGDTVQEALEAIDGYLTRGYTLQQVYDASCPTPTVVMNPTCGPIYFDGTEQVVFNNDGGVDIGQDLIVRGDLTINGTTTTVNTENLFVEDRLIRLNVGTNPGFNNTVGIEAEVGSDGYVEFHWNDTTGRWEISIDRNVTPEAQTFRPLAYLSSTATTLDLSSIGTGGYPTLGPNPDAGASVVNTNITNFPYTFGPYMTDNSVQSALEAIDGYFQDLTGAIKGIEEGLTLQDILNNSCPNPTVSLDCGPLTIEGDGQVIFNNTDGVEFNTNTNITQEVTISGDGPFVINIDGTVNITGDNVNITATNTAYLSGENGVVIDGYGNNVIPANSCTDSLGDPTHGWTDIYICRGSEVIGLGDEGDVNAPNNESGAYVVSTSSTNFDVFGPDMTTNTVQAALEAIDGYLAKLITGDLIELSLQDIYDNSCPNPTIVTTAECGPLTFEGTEQVIFNNDGGVVINEEFTVQGDGPVIIDVTGPVNISSDDDVNIYAGDTVNISGEGGIVLDGYGSDITTTGTGQVIINNEGGIVVNNEFVQLGDGPFIVDITGPVNISTESDLNLTSTQQVNINGEGGIVLDGYGNNVIPAESCTDSLGDATHGWTDIYLCSGSTVIGLNDIGDPDAPNNESGAYVVGTNSTNFLTFGPNMTGDTVQEALEAIDGYLADIVAGTAVQMSLQDIYENSCPNPTITMTEDCGPITFTGPGQVIFNNDGGVVVNNEFTVQGDGPVVIDITGPVNISSEENISITSTQEVHINGEGGIVLDGYGNNVIPASSCSDSLGDATHGWTDIFLCSGSTVIGLNDAGDTDAPNNESGAYVVGTNSTNFDTFGPDMTGNTVQAALEAIDGYFKNLSLEDLDTTYTEERGLDINGAVLNGVVKVSTDSGTPALDFNKTLTSRASWSMPVPSDWDGISDITVEVIWSPEDGGAGNVEWRLEYKSLSLTELASTAASTDDYTQAAGGTADGIQTTGSNLTIPASAIDSINDEIMVINIVRRGDAVGDTYANNAQVHLVKYSYVAQNIV